MKSVSFCFILSLFSISSVFAQSDISAGKGKTPNNYHFHFGAMAKNTKGMGFNGYFQTNVSKSSYISIGTLVGTRPANKPDDYSPASIGFLMFPWALNVRSFHESFVLNSFNYGFYKYNPKGKSRWSVEGGLMYGKVKKKEFIPFNGSEFFFDSYQVKTVKKSTLGFHGKVKAEFLSSDKFGWETAVSVHASTEISMVGLHFGINMGRLRSFKK